MRSALVVVDAGLVAKLLQLSDCVCRVGGKPFLLGLEQMGLEQITGRLSGRNHPLDGVDDSLNLDLS